MAGPRPERDPVTGAAGTVVGEASGRGAASEIEELSEGEFGGLATPLPPQSTVSGVVFGEFEEATPENAPPAEAARRDLRAALGRVDGAGNEADASSLLVEELRAIRISLAKSERERETLETLLKVSSQGVGGPARVVGSSGTGGRYVAPREYSPKNGVGPGKWLFHMEMYFEYAHISGDDRVSHGTMLLRDAAEAWWRAHVLETTGADGTGGPERITTWKALKDSLMSVFTPVSEKEVARSRLYELRQIGSVQSYTQAFRELCFSIDDLSVAEKTTLYHRGLKAHILKDVRLRFPKTLEEAILIAESVDVVGGAPTMARPVRTGTGGRGAPVRRPFQRGRGAGAALHAAGVGAAPGAPAARAVRARPVAARPGVPPAVLAVRRAPPAHGRGRAVDGRREQLRREGRCFTCEQVGHLARDCQGNVPRRRG